MYSALQEPASNFNKSPDTSDCSLVATVGEARMRLFPSYYSGTHSKVDAQGGTQQ